MMPFTLSSINWHFTHTITQITIIIKTGYPEIFKHGDTNPD